MHCKKLIIFSLLALMADTLLAPTAPVAEVSSAKVKFTMPVTRPKPSTAAPELIKAQQEKQSVEQKSIKTIQDFYRPNSLLLDVGSRKSEKLSTTEKSNRIAQKQIAKLQKAQSSSLSSPMRVQKTKQGSKSDIVQEGSAVEAQDFYARMGTSLKAVVDAFSKMTLGTVQKIVNYLNGVKTTRPVSSTPITEEVLINSPEAFALSLTTLPAKQVERVLKFASSKQVVYKADQLAGARAQDLILPNSQSGSFTLSVELVEPVNVQQQQLNLIEKDYQQGSWKDQQSFAKKQSEKEKFSDADNAVKTLNNRIELLKNQIKQDAILKKDMKDKILLSIPENSIQFNQRIQKMEQDRQERKAQREVDKKQFDQDLEVIQAFAASKPKFDQAKQEFQQKLSMLLQESDNISKEMVVARGNKDRHAELMQKFRNNLQNQKTLREEYARSKELFNVSLPTN